jgi:flagella basal body P-ring formation protein FlgA
VHHAPRALVTFGLVAAVGLGLGATTACNRDDAAARRATKKTAYVVERVVPIGKLVGEASDDGSIQKREMPGDVVPDDGVTSVDDLRCLVAATDIPAGAVVRRSMFVEPSKLGLERGLTLGTGPTGCG